ncbi:hypothetical protein COCMIDRAFT_102179 [Bipolaris oryzae ATCC 44560]|uniref:Uncharacterized protein n=1 Tax=Bipolaris oryzae ATCC 44560 TaxID=930090 RepID=W6YU14_COCMI|nr:uncharacterized protein COCMIDRAFT_102179 [Bipolaris oryzae ATCC 44560]EUC42952.1 hypothetical protein COCMIDRAFT_102179 [Bipolaris oryzae ATCC 44560]
MCRIEGDCTYLCDQARSGRTCRDLRRVPAAYTHQKGSASRDDTPSPVNPPTPTNSGAYFTQRRRPSNSGSRPSTRDGQRLNPEIIIEIGSKKGKGSKYPSVSISTKGHKRQSFGSIGSNDAAIDSAESEASYAVRTGFPDAPLPPPAFDQPNTFLPTPLASHGYYHRQTPSASSSQTPSLTVLSEPDYDRSTGRRNTRPSATVIHNSTPAPASPTRPQNGFSSGPYKTKSIVPRDPLQGAQTPTSTNPLDYDQYADYSGSSRASSGIAETTRPTKNSGQRRKKPSEDLRYQEDVDQKKKEDLENDKHVRFELGRYEAREKERAERAQAEKEKEQRAALREEARARERAARAQAEKERERAALKEEERKRKKLERLEQEKKEQEKKELEEKRAKDRKKEKSKPPTTDYPTRPTNTRRMSSLMTPQEQAEQKRLVEADSLIMQTEKQAAEAREREERRAAARQQQDSSTYYDPRAGDRSLSNANAPSKPRRDSVASTMRPSGLTRTSSKHRPSITQPNPPTVSAQPPTDFSTRPSNPRAHAPPPLSFPKTFNQDYGRPPSARRPSLTPDNPFSPSAVQSPAADPWDLRNMEPALPSARSSDIRQHHGMQPRGDPIIHGPTRPVRRAPEYVSAFEDDDDGMEDYPPRFASRTGLSRSDSRRKH